MGISIIIPVYNEELSIIPLYEGILKSLIGIRLEFEIILVDDGSSDETWAKILCLYERDKRIKGLRFSRNFGHQYALFAGLTIAKGNALITMDADLQHPPEIIPKLLDEWKKGKKIVNTIRIDGSEISFFKKTTSNIYYKVFSYLSGEKIHKGMADFRLLDRQVVDEFLKMKESSLFIRGIVSWLGYENSTVKYKCSTRLYGKSKYSLKKMIKFARTGILSFSIVPLRLGTIIGLVTSLLAFIELFLVLYIKLFTDEARVGWASTVGIISFLFGILFIIVGILGEYVGQILIEVRGRPRYIISEELGIN